jgi:hypothetical protein
VETNVTFKFLKDEKKPNLVRPDELKYLKIFFVIALKMNCSVFLWSDGIVLLKFRTLKAINECFVKS